MIHLTIPEGLFQFHHIGFSLVPQFDNSVFQTIQVLESDLRQRMEAHENRAQDILSFR
jgi:hypothetical protein